MKKDGFWYFCCISLAFLFFVFCSVVVYADEPEDEVIPGVTNIAIDDTASDLPGDTVPQVVTPDNVVYQQTGNADNYQIGDSVSVDTPAQLLTADPAAIVTADLIPESDRAGFPGIINDLFGVYTPRTQSVSTYLPDGSIVTSTEIVPGVAGLDFSWISGVVLFALVLFGFLRFLGVIFKR